MDVEDPRRVRKGGGMPMKPFEVGYDTGASDTAGDPDRAFLAYSPGLSCFRTASEGC